MPDDVAAMQASIEALQRVMVRLEADMLELKAATPKAQWQMFRALELENVDCDRRNAECFSDE
jgi:hypothetical protein